MKRKFTEDYRNIADTTLQNGMYRKVIHTVPGHLQLVVMSLEPGEDIPLEVHPETVQFIRIESGRGVALVDSNAYELRDDVSLIIPPGKPHYITNSSKDRPLKLYTIYSPPEHPKNRRQKRQPPHSVIND